MYMLVVVGRPLLTEITEYYQHKNPLLKWLPPWIEGVCCIKKEFLCVSMQYKQLKND